MIYPEAASSLPEISSDGLTYTYTVPPGKFKFNTGEPVTAESFQYALERDLNPKQAELLRLGLPGAVHQGRRGLQGQAR